MKNAKKMISLALFVCLMLSLCACGTPAKDTNPATEPAGGKAVYKVTVTDAAGQPVTSGAVVRFMQNGSQTAMQVVNDRGVAEKELEKGEYTVEMVFTDAEASFYYEEATLTAEKTELTVVLYGAVSGEPQRIAADGKDYDAYRVEEGATYVQLNPGQRTYFLFAPTQAGTYEFTTSDPGAAIGYYGAPHFVQAQSLADVVANTFTVSISAGMVGTGNTGTAVLVIGVDSAELSDCLLKIRRIGEAERTISDEPWTPYETTHTPTSFTLELAAGQSLTYVDIMGKTEDYPVVLGADGFYHMGDAQGPIVYLNLGMEAPNVSLQKVIQGDGLMGGAPIRKYFFDENGEFIMKQDYTDILVSYFKCMDVNYGVYPLTEDLAYILQTACSGWWTVGDPNYILTDCNSELGWLFACCYVKG